MSNTPKLWTTLNEILSHGPCGQEPDDDGELSGYLLLKRNLGDGYGDDTSITLIQILDSNGVDDAIWALRCGMDERFARHLACDFAEHVLPICDAKCPDDNRPRTAIEVARRFADGKATAEELSAAGSAAWAAWSARAAALPAAWDAAWDAAWYARDTAWYARDAAWDTERERQAQRIRERYEEFTNVH